MKISSLVFLLLSGLGALRVSGVPAWGQAGAAKSGDPYAAEPLVIVKNTQVVEMAADGTGVRTRTVEARIQGESMLKQLGVLGLPFAASAEHVEWVYARVRHADGTLTETPVTNAMEIAEPVTQEAPFYSDLKQMQLPIRDLRLGDTLEWQAKIVRTKAEAPGEFWGQDNFPEDAVTLSDTYELRVPKSKYVQVWSPKVKPVESEEGEERVYRWTWQQLKPTVGPAAVAAKDAEKKKVWTPEQELDAREGKLPDFAWTTFKSWDAVGAWYRGLEVERAIPDADVKAKVAQITAGKTTEQDKVQAVYGYVSTQIRYIGVSFGIGRYQPHSAGDVLANQYGDCKDKHTLLAAMLEVLGVRPDAVLIGTGVRFNDAVPSPSSFNHLITRVELGGKPVWLDSTAEVAPFGMLLHPNRDHEALVIPPTGEAKVERTPAMPPFPMYEHMDSQGTLDAEGTSNSKLTLTSRGDDEVLLRSVLRQVSPAQYDLLVQRMCAGMGYSGTPSDPEVSKPEDMSGPVTISFAYKRSKAGDWANLRTIPQLSPVSLPRPDDKDPPVQELQLGVPRVESSSAAMKLPEGWGAVLPEAIHQKSKWATYDETYKFEKGTLYSERRIEVLQPRVEVKDWKEYGKFATAADVGNEQYIQLVKHDAGDSHTITLGVTRSPVGDARASNADAAKLVFDAYNAIARHDLAAAEPKLDLAKAMNAKQSWLWSAYGNLCFQRGEMAAAVEDYQKELEYHPELVGVYRSLADAQVQLGRTADARKTLEKWESVDAANPLAAARLTAFLIAEGEPAAAAAAAEAALPKLGTADTEELRVVMGKAQLAAGMKEKGDATLTGILRSTDNPGILNDAAYELADAGLELPLEEASSRKAVARQEDETKSWTLDENPQQLRQKTSLLEASWDTLGWILYREGKLDEAKGYVEAAWRGRQSTEVGEHLGDLETAKGEKSAALGTYGLALKTTGSGNATKVVQDQAKELSAKIAALRKEGVVDPVTDASQSFQKLRNIPLGSAGGLNGVAEYKLLLSAAKVEQAEPTGEKSLAGGVERLQKASVVGFIPAGSQAKLVKLGMLNCHSGVCELVLEP
jgi:tetratricopeptide (TPR) repeat protein